MRLGTVLAVALALTLARSARPEPPSGQAKTAYDAGITAYAAKDYTAAARHLGSAYRLHADPAILFAWAQAERLSGDCKTAVGLYRRFLELRPPAIQADAARRSLSRCTTQLAGPGSAGTDPGAALSSSGGVERAPRRWYLDPLGDGLVLGGTVAAAVGIGLLASGDGVADDAGAVTVIVGGALIASGAVRLVLVKRAGGGMVAVAGRF